MPCSASARNTELNAATRRASSGFSLIELVTVVVIIGALAFVVVPRLNVSGFEQYAFRQEVLAGLRYAQKTAMAEGCELQVTFEGAADRISLDYDTAECGNLHNNSFDQPVPDPTGGNFVREAESGADLTEDGTLVFDQFGGVGQENLGGDTTISFSTADSITVNRVTGYVDG